MLQNQDERWMRLALEAAKAAGKRGEVPIGALLLSGEGELLAINSNRTIADCDPTAHGEMLVLREAAAKVGNYRLLDCALYVTVEPCAMCAGALVQARVRKLVFGAYNLRGGACGTCFDLTRNAMLNHHIHEVKGGVLEAECAALIQDFFRMNKRVK